MHFFFKYIIIKSREMLRIYGSILQLKIYFIFWSHADPVISLPWWKCTILRCTMHSGIAWYQGAHFIANGRNTKYRGWQWILIVPCNTVQLAWCIMEVQRTKVKNTRWIVGVSIVISIEILKSYGFTIFVVLNDYDSTQNRYLVKLGKIAHLSFSFINLA